MSSKDPPDYNTYTIQSNRDVDELGLFDTVALYLFGGFFQERRDNFKEFQKTLTQAQMDDGYDLYLSRLLLWLLVLLVSSLLLTVLAAMALFGLYPGVDLLGMLPESMNQRITQFNPILISGFLFFTLAFLLAGIPTLLLYIIPWYRAGEREREIDTMLPYTVTFMYALSRGGSNLVNVLKTVGESEDVYGEASNEFKTIVRDMEFFDSDLRGALRAASQETPSEKFTDFVDDLISIVDTGGDLENFLLDKTEEYLQESRREQENFLETLSLMGEVYVTVFVAGPLFVIIIITVMALIGGSSINLLLAIVYGLLPLGNIGFAFLVDIMKSGKSADSNIGVPSYEMNLEELAGYDDKNIQNLHKMKRREKIKETIFKPYSTFREHPSWTLVLTTPIAAAYLGVSYLLYGIPIDSLVKNSVELTAVYGVIPLLILLSPISFFHEIQTRRKNRILKRIPSMLKKLSSANATGMSLEESFDIVANSTEGEMGKELKRVKNDIDWRGDLSEALVRFARRIDTPRLARTVKLVTKAARSTGNITEVIDVAAKDVMQTHRLERDRRQEMAMYTVIIIVSFLVYLLVVVMLNEAFLSKIATVSQPDTNASSELPGGGGPGGMGAGFNLSDLPVNMYNMVFYHSTIIQAFGAGLIAGQMGRDDMMSGLKFSLTMIVVATVVFMVI